jgi:phage-related protein
LWVAEQKPAHQVIRAPELQMQTQKTRKEDIELAARRYRQIGD